MIRPLVIISGTGTEIGKTHFSEALLLRLGRAGHRAAGVKPIESGISQSAMSDGDRLRSASTFHVKPFGYTMSAPISPHLAAAEARISISVPSIVAGVEEVRGLPDFLLLELPGGLFSPIGPDTLNIDLVRALRSDTLLLVAPDRLGVLHDVIAATRAARSDGVKVDGIILVTPDSTDPSTGRNAAEISHLTDGIPVLATLPRASPIDIASSDILEELLIRLETPRRSHTRFVPL